MKFEQLIAEGARNPWVFWTLALLAIISAWQPTLRVLVFGKNLIVGAFKKGIVEYVRGYRHSVVSKASEISVLGEKQIALLISYTTFSIISGIQTILMFVVGTTIFNVVKHSNFSNSDPYIYMAYTFFVLGGLNLTVWLFDGLYQLFVHHHLRVLLK